MSNRSLIFAALVAAVTIASVAPATADGVVVITQAKALAGNVTPRDAPGFPVTINMAGSYQLGSNLIPGAGQNGIEVKAAHVGIDLNGFTLAGENRGGSGVSGDRPDLRIHNGAVVNFKANGIIGSGSNWVVEKVAVTGNGGDGVKGGSFFRILDSTVVNNGNYGVNCAESCHVQGNIVSRNASWGVFALTGTVLGNTIIENGAYGLVGGLLVGYGNNTIIGNNKHGTQALGLFLQLFPNACFPPPCP